ncbi:MAG: oxidoreductase [Prochlorococcaceae cyanobacterium]|jgi:NAD-reducing hydrogenase small subunit
MSPTPRWRMATAWLSGCSGCHMSLLDLDEGLLALAVRAEIVYSPIGSDTKVYPERVDVCLVEGAVATTADHTLALTIRQRTRLVVAFGDCALRGNVPALRNLLGAAPADGAAVALDRAYRDLAEPGGAMPAEPALLSVVLPLHRVITVDAVLAGCPPPAAQIAALLERLLP